jgi:putative two-component system response regulator
VKPRALVVEASPARRRLLEAVLALEGFDVQARAEAGEPQGHPPDLVVLGSCLSGTDPFSLCSGIKERDRLVPVLMVAEGEEGRLRGWEVGADEVLLRPLRRRELASRARALVRLRRLYEGLVEGEKVLLALAEAVEAQDPYARGHTRKALAGALALGERAGLSAEDLRELRPGAILHDVGKVGLDRAILLKGGPLSPEEWRGVKAHPALGWRIARLLGKGVGEVVRYHHERWDGGGYPEGLKGEEIPLLARIMALVDAFSALTSPRPYRPAFTPERARRIIAQESGKQFDPGLVRLFQGLPSLQEGI